MENILFDIAVIIIAAGIIGFIAKSLKQPLIPAYIITGIILGPVFNIITDKSIISQLSEIGIAFLLFIVGLELNVKKLRSIGSVASIGGLIHMGLLFIVSYISFIALGFSKMISMYVGIILMFSSTLVIVKLLSDKNELDTLHGRIVIGILLMQDIVAVIALSILNNLGNNSIGQIAIIFLKGILVFAIGLGAAKIIFSSAFKFAARNTEMLFLLSITMMFLFATIYELIGFSIVIGAFVAGLLLGNLPYNLEIIGRVEGIKDFFSVIFFVTIGLKLISVDLASLLLPLGIMLILTLIVLPIITLFVLGLFGYKKRPAFMISIILAQISEFGLIIAGIGLDKGHIPPEIFSLTILVAIITIALTAYLIKYDEKLYQLIGSKLNWFDKLSKHNKGLMTYMEKGEKHKVILIGYDRMGYGIFQKLKKMKKNVVVIDLNPDIIKKLISQRIPCIYGDIGDHEIVKRLRLNEAELVISTIPEHDETKLLIQRVRKHNPEATIIVTSFAAEDALELYEEGADYVVIPHFLGGDHLSLILEDLTTDLNKLLSIKIKHIKDLEERNKKHPYYRHE